LLFVVAVLLAAVIVTFAATAGCPAFFAGNATLFSAQLTNAL
jgi:hypothetical protein